MRGIGRVGLPVGATLFLLTAGLMVVVRGQTQKALPSASTSLPSYVLYEHDVSTSRGSKPGVETDFIKAQRRDGSRAVELTVAARWSPNGQAGKVQEIWDVPKGVFIETEPFTRSISTFHLTRNEISDLQHPDTTCNGVVPGGAKAGTLPSKTMLGHKVFRFAKQFPRETMVLWLAPDLNCFPLVEEHTMTNGARLTKTVVKITEGEPPTAMFTPPSNYTERSPEELEATYEKDFHGHVLLTEWALENQMRKYSVGR